MDFPILLPTCPTSTPVLISTPPPRIPAPCRTFTSPLVAHVPKPGALQPSTGLGLSEAALGGEGSLSALAAGTLWQQRWRWHLTAPVAYAFREQLLQAH